MFSIFVPNRTPGTAAGRSLRAWDHSSRGRRHDRQVPTSRPSLDRSHKRKRPEGRRAPIFTAAGAINLDKLVPLPEPSEATLAEEEHILRCLGAALIMQWHKLPTELQRVLVDNAGSMGELSDSDTLRGQIARFLRNRTGEIARSSVKS